MSDPMSEWSAWADETRRRLVAKGNVEAIEDHRMSYYLAGWLDGQRGDTEPLQESISNAHDATIYERGRAHGINAERSAIVAWLREPETRARTYGFVYAAAIERGEHLRGNNE